MKLPEQFIQEISQFETIYCLVSGGYHSTTSALLLKDYGFENVILVHNKTYLESKRSMEIIEKTIKTTGYKYIELIPDLKNETVWDIIKKALYKIPEVMEDIKEKKYDRSKFECCRKLKKSPMGKFMRMTYSQMSNSPGNLAFIKNEIPNKIRVADLKRDQNSNVQTHSSPISKLVVVIDSQCPYESANRLFRMREIRNNNTFIRFLRKEKYWKAYPLRDQFKEKPFYYYLLSKGFSKVQHSGCVICPILICFKIYNKRYYNTLKAMARAGLPCFQRAIVDFMEE